MWRDWLPRAMRDRIAVFRIHYEADNDTPDARAIIDTSVNDPNEEEVKTFLRQAQQARDKIQAIEADVAKCKEVHGKIHGSAVRDDKNHNDLDALMVNIRKLVDVVKNALKLMETTFTNVEEKDRGDVETGQSDRPADIRIMKSQFQQLQCSFFEVWTDYNECQSNYREKCKEKLMRQIQITGKEDVSTDEINKMIESGNPTIFSYNSSFQQKDIQELESRQNDITKLAESLKQLHEMFKDLALMVEQQGEMLNNIEKNVDAARDYVGAAERECSKAVDLTNQFRKKKLICAIVIIILLIIIAAIIAITIELKK